MKKILVIDDDATILDSVSQFLKEEGFDVHTANNGALGTQVAIEIIPDIIICDVSMPKMNGYEVCRTLQSIPATRLIPFVFLTSNTQKEDIRQGMQLGADDYLTKPVEYEELIKCVQLRLEKYERHYHEGENKIYALIDNPIVGVYIYHDNKFSYANSKLADMLGYSKEELHIMSFEDLLSSDDNDAALEKIHRCIKGISNSVHTELMIAKKDLSTSIIEIYGTIIKIKGKDSLIGNMTEIRTQESEKKCKEHSSLKPKLSDREIEILQLICAGLSSAEISEKLFLSQRTIDAHRANLISKTESGNTAGLVMYAIRNGIIKL